MRVAVRSLWLRVTEQRADRVQGHARGRERAGIGMSQTTPALQS
jgi:hypothetical protein